MGDRIAEERVVTTTHVVDFFNDDIVLVQSSSISSIRCCPTVASREILLMRQRLTTLWLSRLLFALWPTLVVHVHLTVAGRSRADPTQIFLTHRNDENRRRSVGE